MVTRQSSDGETRIPFTIGNNFRSLILGGKTSPELDVKECDEVQMIRSVCCNRSCMASLCDCVSLRIVQLSFFELHKNHCKEETYARKTDNKVKQDWEDDEFFLPFSTPESIREIVVTDSDTLSIKSIESFSTIPNDENAFGRLDFEENEEEFHDVEI